MSGPEALHLVLENMRRQWNERAAQNAEYYVFTGVQSGEDFAASGRDVSEKFWGLDNVLVEVSAGPAKLDAQALAALGRGAHLGRSITCYIG